MTRLSRYRPDQQKHKKRALILAIMMIVLSVFDIFSSSVSAASSHTTRINLSADQVKQNGGSTVTSGYTYRFLYNTDGGTSAYPLGDYSSQNWYNFKPSEISRLNNYTGAVFIFADSKKNGTSVWSKYKILNIIPKDEESLKATGTVTSAGSYTVGDKLIVTMTASGGKAPYTYKYEYGTNTERLAALTAPTRTTRQLHRSLSRQTVGRQTRTITSRSRSRTATARPFLMFLLCRSLQSLYLFRQLHR